MVSITTVIVFAAGFASGALAGWAGFLLFLRYRTRKQLSQMEEQMGQMLDLEPEPEE